MHGLSLEWSAAQIKRKLYEGELYLFDIVNEAIEDAEETSEGTYLPKAGGTMTGNLAMGSHYIAFQDSPYQIVIDPSSITRGIFATDNTNRADFKPTCVKVSDGDQETEITADGITYSADSSYSFAFPTESGTLGLEKNDVGSVALTNVGSSLGIMLISKNNYPLAEASLSLATAEEVEALL